ncbi:MAG TPA: hypothetical protein VFC21_10625 [Bryobacteraceae bacterium]|nr:hypothetical protein [Bryobacteraceae bacterium]
MATLATFFKRSDAIGVRAERVTAARAESDPFRLRALPNDDIYLYYKRIDNARLVRQADPLAGTKCWSAVGAAGIVFMIGASIIAPIVGSVLEGYKIESLKQERQSLIDRERALEVREAALLSPGRLNELAREQNLTVPAGNQVIHLDNPSFDGTFAKNQAPAAPGLVR